MNHFRWFAGVCLVALTTPVAAQAQPADKAVYNEDIIVTAARREQRLQDVPVAVTALTSDALRTQGIASVGDLGSGKVPGLAVNSMFGSEVSINVNIRGYGSPDPSQGTQDQPVAFYIDGINIPRAQGMAQELITPERIEVLRGPQGQLFGRNAEAGAIQIVSRRPKGVLNGEVSGGYGNFDSRFVKGRIDLPEFAGFRIQLSGLYRAHGGYIRNIPSANLEGIQLYTDPNSSFRFPTGNYDKDFNRLNSHGFRIAAERDFGDLNAFYVYDDTWAEDDQGLAFFVNSPSVGSIFNPYGGNATATGRTSTGTVFTQPPLDTSKYPEQVPYAALRVPFVTKSHGHLLNLSLAATDNLTIKSITGVRQTTRMGGNQLSLALSSVQPASNEYLKSDTFSQEIQALYNVGTFNLTTGAIYFYESVKDERTSLFSTNCLAFPNAPCDGTTLPSRNPFPSPFLPAGTSGFTRQFSKTDAIALYGQASWKPPIFDEKLEFTVGLRFSHDVKRARRTFSAGLPVLQTNVARTERLDPAVMVRFQFTPDINIYGRVAKGFRDGGANVRSLTFNAYEPETLDSYEVGLKSQWFDRRVTFNVAAFHNDVNNQQLAIQPDPAFNPSVTDTFNLPLKYKTNGIEADLSVRPLPGLTLSGNYTYLHSNFRNIIVDNFRTFAATNVTFAPNGGLIPSATDLAAHPNAQFLQIYPIGSPKHSGSIGMDYTVPVSDDIGRLSLHAEWMRSGDMIIASPIRLATLSVNGVARQRNIFDSPVSTNRVNGRLSLSDIPLAGGVKAEVSMWVKNAFNHVDFSHAFAAGNAISVPGGAASATPLPQAAVYLQPPRTFGADLRIQF